MGKFLNDILYHGPQGYEYHNDPNCLNKFEWELAEQLLNDIAVKMCDLTPRILWRRSIATNIIRRPSWMVASEEYTPEEISIILLGLHIIYTQNAWPAAIETVKKLSTVQNMLAIILESDRIKTLKCYYNLTKD